MSDFFSREKPREFSLQTKSQHGFYDITADVRKAVKENGTQEGICIVYCPHTTAAITINENADPYVAEDVLFELNKVFPNLPEFKHNEGNSAAHVLTSVVGASETILINNGDLILGVWQSIYFCEFDGPRDRKYYVKVIEG